MARKIHGGEDNPLVQCINPILDQWMILWSLGYEDGSFAFMAEETNHKPTLQEIKNIVLEWYNSEISNKILTGFTWKGNQVWLSMENQFNYKSAYDLAVQSGGKILPIFKLGDESAPTYYEFTNLEELKEFYLGYTGFITDTISAGWKTKDSIDWTAYSKILDEE